MTLEVFVAEGIGDVTGGDDLATLLVEHLDRELRTGDVVVVTSKVVSKAAGLVVSGSRADLLAGQTDRVVARRGQTRIVRTPHGLTMAAGGIDESNAPSGTAVPLPPDPDADARGLRDRIGRLTGARVAVVVSDTAGRAWRTGQTDLAIGAAGLLPVVSLSGERDPYGNVLEVTAPAVADEIAAAADLVKGKLTGCPFAVVRGVPAAWLTVGDGPGAAALVRAEDADMFGLGAVEAVRVAVGRDRPVRGFPAAEPGALDVVVREAMRGVDDAVVTVEPTGLPALEVVLTGVRDPEAWTAAGAVLERLRVLSAALGVDLPISLREDSHRREA
ncbi:MAG: coenzyme F420-0:L-glutamate ligase [Nocardioidaceae bacterium]